VKCKYVEQIFIYGDSLLFSCSGCSLKKWNNWIFKK
jgi:hypothetical protein